MSGRWGVHGFVVAIFCSLCGVTMGQKWKCFDTKKPFDYVNEFEINKCFAHNVLAKFPDSMKKSLDSCEGYSDEYHHWSLAKFDSMEKYTGTTKEPMFHLDQDMPNVTLYVNAHGVAWLGLIRYANTTEWKWIIDNTTMSESEASKWWKHDGQSKSAFDSNADRCAVVEIGGSFTHYSIKWIDLPCELPHEEGADMDHVLCNITGISPCNFTSLELCESNWTGLHDYGNGLVKGTTNEPDSSSEIPWEWVLLGCCAGICVLVFTILGTVCFVRRRRYKKNRIGRNQRKNPQSAAKADHIGKKSEMKESLQKNTAIPESLSGTSSSSSGSTQGKDPMKTEKL